MAVKLKMLKKVDILGCTYKVIWEKSHNGGSFSWGKSEIRIGIEAMHKDPLYTFSILSHEIMEATYAMMGARFDNGRISEDYLFNFNHQTFENAIQIHTQAISQFIDWK